MCVVSEVPAGLLSAISGPHARSATPLYIPAWGDHFRAGKPQRPDPSMLAPKCTVADPHVMGSEC